MKTKIITERLSLDILTINDHAFIRELVNTEGWLKFIGDRKIYSDEDAIAYIDKSITLPLLLTGSFDLKKPANQ